MLKPVSPLRSYVASFALLCAMAMPAHGETLEQAVETALNNHPSIAAAFAGRSAAQDVQVEKRSAYFPELNVNAATGRVYGDNSTSRGLTVDRGAGYSWNHEVGFTVRQMIYDGNETSNRVNAAAARAESAAINVLDIRENLALRAALAYLDVLRNREAVAMIRDHAGKISDYRARIGKMVEEGVADESLSVQAHDIQNQLDATLADVEGQLNQAIAEYGEIVGPAVIMEMTRPKPLLDVIPPDVEEAVMAARESHPAILAARLEGQAAQHDTKAERGVLYPDISGEVSMYKKDLADIIGGEVVDDRALVRMNWEFATGGAQAAKIRQSLHNEAETKARMDELAGQLEREIRKSYAEMNAAKQRMIVGQDRVKVSADLVSAYQKQFEVAKVNLLNLLQVENTRFIAEMGVLNADYRYQSAQYSVLANAGRLQDALNVKPVMAAHGQ